MPRRKKRGYGRGTIARDGRSGSVMINGKRVFRRGANAEEVAAKLDLVLGHAESRLRAAGTTMTVVDMLDAYMADQWAHVDDGDLRRSTVDKKTFLVAHLKMIWPTQLAVNLTPKDVEAGMTKIRRTGRKAEYVGRIQQVLGQAYRWAIVESILNTNPATAARTVKGSSTPTGEPRPLTLDEARALLDAADGHWAGVVAYLGVLAGLRVQEIRGLTVHDVDLQRCTLTVTGEADRYGLRTDPKTRTSARTVHIVPELADTLRAHLERIAEVRRKMGWQWPDNDLVVPSRNGTTYDAANLRRYMRQWLSAAGVDRPITTKDLRATCATIAVDNGATAWDVAQLLGHVDTRTAERHYFGRRRIQEGTAVVGAALARTSTPTRNPT
jgi:integrase